MILNGMDKLLKEKGRKDGKPYISISKSGWCTVRDALVKNLDANKYNSVDFFYIPNDIEKHIAIELYKGKKGQMLLRHRSWKPRPIGCGFCLIGFVKNNPDYIGKYEVEMMEEEGDSKILLLKPVK